MTTVYRSAPGVGQAGTRRFLTVANYLNHAICRNILAIDAVSRRDSNNRNVRAPRAKHRVSARGAERCSFGNVGDRAESPSALFRSMASMFASRAASTARMRSLNLASRAAPAREPLHSKRLTSKPVEDWLIDQASAGYRECASTPTRGRWWTARCGLRPSRPRASAWRSRWSRRASGRRRLTPTAHAVARPLVVYARTPRYPSQLSAELRAQGAPLRCQAVTLPVDALATVALAQIVSLRRRHDFIVVTCRNANAFRQSSVTARWFPSAILRACSFRPAPRRALLGSLGVSLGPF